MNGLQVFNYHDKEVRTVQRDGEPWWVLTDICEALELKSPHKVAARLDDDEKGRTFLPTLGGEQELTIVNEPGLYTVILRSNNPEAKKFKRWVTHEVLPSIRKTGAYATQPDARLEALTEEVRKLTECVATIIERLNEPTLQISQTRDSTIPGKAARRRWMRTLNEKLDLLEVRFGASRYEILCKIYEFIEQKFNVLLDEERLKTIEQHRFDDCSKIIAIFYNEKLRLFLQSVVDRNLAPENRGW